MRKLTRAGGGFRCVSGTSNTPLEMVSRRPGDTSTMPLPSVTLAVRPVTRTFMSASRIAGSPSTGRSVAALPTISTDRPSSGISGPPGCNAASGALVAMSRRSTVPLTICSITQSRTFGRDECRPQPLERAHRHRIAGDAEREPRLAAVVELAGHRDGDAVAVGAAEFLGAEIALLERDPLLAGSMLPRTTTRLSTSPSSSGDQRIEHDQPPPMANSQLPPGCAGAANSERSVKRAAPAVTLNGMRSVRRALSQSSPNSALLIGI